MKYFETPKHSVIIITYNQELLISRTMKSVLCQMDLIWEIIIVDDCSTDNTWEVIKSYKQEYSKIIKAFRNESNLGIIANTESTYNKASGDIIWFIAGDDEFCKGIFSRANDVVRMNQIDVKSDLFTLYFDHKVVYPNGKELVRSNRKIVKNDAVSLKLRQLISNRTTGIGSKVFEKFSEVSKDVGLMADGLIDIQTQMHSEKNYYNSFIGSIYYASIGVSHTTSRAVLLESEIKFVQELLSKYDFDNANVTWLNYVLSKLLFQKYSKIRDLPLVYLKYLYTVNIRFGLKFFFIEFLKLNRAVLNTLILMKY